MGGSNRISRSAMATSSFYYNTDVLGTVRGFLRMEGRIDPGRQGAVRIVVHKKRHNGRSEHPGKMGRTLGHPGRFAEELQMFSRMGRILVVEDPYQMLFFK